MNSIPLIKGNTPQEINTSIIALKKALSELEAQDRLLQGTDKDIQNKIKQINELIKGINTHLGTVDAHLSTIDGQITALQPVDTVTSGNMQSVTSNAVANIMQSAIALVDAGYHKIDASQGNFIWRSATLCSINIYDNTRTGISVDFDFGANQIRVYTVVNGVTMGQKNVNLS